MPGLVASPLGSLTMSAGSRISYETALLEFLR